MLAHAAVKAGADLVIGDHPHVLQGLEFYQGSLVAYSLGNFVFPSHRPETRQTAILTYTRGLDGRSQVRLTPCVIAGGKPFMAKPKDGKVILARVRRLSAQLGTELSREGTLAWSGTHE